LNDDTRRTPPPRRDLAHMKRLAAGLLALAALLYAVATALQGRHPAWRYLAAFAEAAMIGAIADWFAVVALFRHPLGLPIPHTAIIPANKARIGRELADFICDHFLDTPHLLQKLREFDPARQLAGWLADPARTDRLGRHAAAVARHGLAAFDDERVRHFVRGAMVEQLGRLDAARLAGQLLDLLTAQGRHQALLDALLKQSARVLEHEEVHERVADAIAAEVKFLRYVGLDAVAGRVAAKKLMAGLARLVQELAEDPQHELRQRLDASMAGLVGRLQQDDELRQRAQALLHDVLQHPSVGAYLQQLWGQLMGWLQADLQRDDSTLRRHVGGLALALGQRLQADAAMQQWINDQLMAAAPPVVARYREDIRRYIASRVEAWDTAEMTRELERSIGRDLQFVRINGTLVGGLIGLAIFSVTEWLRRF
jgi:uncharacterized membrane-anchored protein YjiN (DUF445 family)